MDTTDRPLRPNNHHPRRIAKGQPTASPADDDEALLYTPAEAAQRLRVRESWLRRKAAARQVPCTFLGKHLRFSPADLAAIIARAAQPPTGRRHGRSAARQTDLTHRPRRSVDQPCPDDHIYHEGSSPWPG